jgi:ferric-dicitrate binding protein FerR (iron transport regulator)
MWIVPRGEEMMMPTLSSSRTRNRRIAAAGWALVALVASTGLADWITDGFGVRWQGPEVIAVYAIGLLALVLSSIGIMRCGVPRHRPPRATGASRPLGLPRRDWAFAMVFAVTAAPGLWAIRNWASAEALLATCR